MALKYWLVGGWIALIWSVWGLGGEATAGMIGSPVATVQSHGLAGGVEVNIINREIDFSTGASPNINMIQVLFRGTYGLIDRVNLFLTIGTADDDFKVPNFSTGVELKFLAEPTVAYGGGFKLTLYEFPKFLLGAGGQYEQFSFDSFNSTNRAPPENATLDWREYRFFIGAHLQDVPYFVPYGGLYMTKLSGKLSFSSLSPTDVGESHSMGIFYGGDFKVWKKAVLSAELHLIAENAITFSLQYSF